MSTATEALKGSLPHSKSFGRVVSRFDNGDDIPAALDMPPAIGSVERPGDGSPVRLGYRASVWEEQTFHRGTLNPRQREDFPARKSTLPSEKKYGDGYSKKKKLY